MKRFILLTFGFMGWAFYEMSGGDEFESASDRHARLNPAPAVVVTKVDDAPAPQTVVTAAAEPAVVDTDPPLDQDVTRVALNLTTLQNAVAAVDPETGVAVNTDTTLSSADTPAIIPSLIAPSDAGAESDTATTSTASVSVDVRRVSGNRVNVRGGPGTDFGVVSKLVRGDTVEIIQDNGDGWVLMRPVSGGTQGWMADFLLTSG